MEEMDPEQNIFITIMMYPQDDRGFHFTDQDNELRRRAETVFNEEVVPYGNKGAATPFLLKPEI